MRSLIRLFQSFGFFFACLAVGSYFFLIWLVFAAQATPPRDTGLVLGATIAAYLLALFAGAVAGFDWPKDPYEKYAKDAEADEEAKALAARFTKQQRAIKRAKLTLER